MNSDTHDYIKDGLPEDYILRRNIEANKTHEFLGEDSVCVYIIKKEANVGEVYYKIGISSNPRQRLDQLNNHPKEINLISFYEYKTKLEALRIEKLLHKFLDEKRVRREWFLLQDNELILIDSMIRTFTNCVYIHIETWHFTTKSV